MSRSTILMFVLCDRIDVYYLTTGHLTKCLEIVTDTHTSTAHVQLEINRRQSEREKAKAATQFQFLPNSSKFVFFFFLLFHRHQECVLCWLPFCVCIEHQKLFETVVSSRKREEKERAGKKPYSFRDTCNL